VFSGLPLALHACTILRVVTCADSNMEKERRSKKQKTAETRITEEERRQVRMAACMCCPFARWAPGEACRGRRWPLCEPLNAPAAPQAAELESFLFSKHEAALDRLGEEHAPRHGDFGSVADLVREAGLAAIEVDEERGLLMFEDRAGGAAAAADGRQAGTAVAGQQVKRPVWDDPDDALVEVNVASRNRLRKLRQAEEEILLSGMQLVRAAPAAAPANPQTL
jgi:hypothetical protein